MTATTPLQRATLLLDEAIRVARSDGARTFYAFLDIAVVRLAADVARRLDREPRP